jgi:eukaryotic-like serine/threonine-protein kinase
MSTLAAENDFREAAIRSGLLTRQTADAIERSAAEQGISFAEATAQSGALTAPQLEIIETLRRPGSVAPGYEIVSLLGEGGMGVVYRAKQLAFDRIVALKLVRIAAANPSGLARFEQEARTIGRLVHPHIVTAFDFSQHAGRFFLALELVDGQDAERYIEQHAPLAEAMVWHLIRQAASGLAYAAESGVIHRDIKPANLLLVTSPKGFPLPAGVPLVKIADFGLALLQDAADDRTRLTMEHTTVGSPLYMAPEQLSGSRVDLRADIYALGATAYHLLSGQPPFAGLTLAQTYAQKLHGEPTPLARLRADLSPPTVDLVEWLMRRDPDQRVADYAAVITAIDTVLASFGGTSSASGRVTPSALDAKPPAVIAPERAPSGPTRRRWLVLAAIAAWVLIATAVTGYVFLAPTTLPAGPRNWQPTGWGVNCFNGRNLDGWRTLAGNWIPGQDDGEGGRVLAGSGQIAYPLVKTGSGSRTPLLGFRLLALASLRTATAIELQFGLNPTQPVNTANRYVLRMSESRIQLGQRASDAGPLDKLLRETESTVPRDVPVEWKLERQADEWLVFVDGNLLAAIPDSADSQPVFLFAAERPAGQPDALAWFSDIELEELAPPAQ